MIVTLRDAPRWARGLKRCHRCDTVKGLKEFSRNRSRPDGRQDQCKPCSRAQVRNHYSRNAERIRESKAEYRARNLDKVRAARLRWYYNNRDKAEVHSRRRRALKAGAETDGWTRADVLRVAEEADAYGCFWCGGPAGEDWHADHAYPLSRGGADRLENIVIACSTCNLSKNARIPYEEWTP